MHPSNRVFHCFARWIQQGRTIGLFTELVTSAQPPRWIWWAKFGDPASAKVKVSKAEAAVARFIAQVVKECVPVPLVVCNSTGPAAADAFAEGQTAGFGGLVAASWCPVAARVFAVFFLSASLGMTCRIGSDRLPVIYKVGPVAVAGRSRGGERSVPASGWLAGDAPNV